MDREQEVKKQVKKYEKRRKSDNGKRSGKSLTGKPLDQIELDPQLKPELDTGDVNEQSRGSVVLAFGRMNPITVGHEKLVKKVIDYARRTRATPMIYLSHSQDKNSNPLEYDDKIRYARMAFGNIVKKSRARTIIEIMKELQRTFGDITLVAGSDRVKDFDRLLQKYNGKEYHFNNIQVVSAGERDPDAEGVSGMSASKMRAAAKAGDVRKFKTGLPPRLRSRGTEVYDMVRSGMKIAEELEAEGLNQLDEVLSIQQRRKKAMMLRKYKAKIQRARALAKKKIAPTEKLRARANRQARRIVRSKVAGKRGKNYNKLTPSERVNVDKAVQKRKAMVGKIANRIFPKVKAAEFERLKAYMTGKSIKNLASPQGAIKEDSDVFYGVVSDFIEHEITEKERSALAKKGMNAGIDYNTLEEIFVRGLFDTHCDHKAAFDRVNSFLAAGKTALQEDRDLYDMAIGGAVNALFEKEKWARTEKKTDKGTAYVEPHRDRHGDQRGWKASNGKKVQYFRTQGLKAAHKHAGIEYNESTELTEGVHDPAIFKAVFLAGGPGSGKSFVVGQTSLQALGFKLINSDVAFERAMEKAKLEPNSENIYSEKGQQIRARAKALTKKQMSLAVSGRLGLIIDGTGKDVSKIEKQKQMLEKLGYETAMIFVNTDVQTATDRNNARPRSLPTDKVNKMWKQVQDNIGHFSQVFGRNMYIVDNSEGSNYRSQVTKIYKQIQRWISFPPRSPIAKRWIKSQLNEARPTDPEERKKLDHLDKMWDQRKKDWEKRQKTKNEDVKTADKEPVTIPAWTDENGKTHPAKTVMKKRNKKIIRSGNVHDGDDSGEPT